MLMVGGINPRFLAFRILKIDPLFIACHNLAGTTFFFVWQAEFGMCFGVAPSAYRSCGTHFPIF